MQYLRWIAVDERLPDEELRLYRQEYGEYACPEFIVYINNSVSPTFLLYDENGFFAENDSYSPWDEGDASERDYYPDVTHWMNMPPTPNECRIDIDLRDSFKPEYEMLEVIYT